MKFMKGDMNRLSEVVIFLALAIVVMLAISGLASGSRGYTCKGATESAIQSMKSTIEGLDQNVQIGTASVQPKPLKIPSCVTCVKVDRDHNLIFELEGEEKPLKLEGKGYYKFFISEKQIKDTCTDVVGGKKYDISVTKDSLEQYSEIKIRFNKVE